MPLDEEQRAAIETVAKREGVDPAKLAAAAERIAAGKPTAPADSTEPADKTGDNQAKLYMYLLPFVTVKEVREKWLGLTDSFAGDSAVASDWAAKHGGAATEKTGAQSADQAGP